MESLKSFLQTLCKNGCGNGCTIEDIVVQVGIALFGCTAIWFVGRPESWRRWGYMFGLCAQPFWFYMSIKESKWGLLALSCLYAYSWAQGVWFNWIKPNAITKDYFRRVKNRALELGISEKELLAEMAREYFQNHPVAQQKL